jgi:response regulator RpfG family c-di-GMP phosphodiesterase
VLRIMCAFQTEEIFDFVKSAFKNLECELIKASSEALALFLAQKNFPCLVVSELEPESGWGMNILSELKAESELAHIPLVFIARRPAGMTVPELAVPQGAEMLIWYPVESYEFLSSVRKYLREMKDERPLETPE